MINPYSPLNKMEEKELIGKKFLKIEDSEFGDIKITFIDGTTAYYDCHNYPDGTISEIQLQKIKDVKENILENLDN